MKGWLMSLRAQLQGTISGVLSSRTTWINVIALAYVLLTGNVEDLQRFQLSDTDANLLITIINVLNVATRSRTVATKGENFRNGEQGAINAQAPHEEERR